MALPLLCGTAARHCGFPLAPQIALLLESWSITPIEFIAVLAKEEEIYWLALTLAPGLGTRTADKLLERFRTPQAIFRASLTELETAGVSARSRKRPRAAAAHSKTPLRSRKT